MSQKVYISPVPLSPIGVTGKKTPQPNIDIGRVMVSNINNKANLDAATRQGDINTIKNIAKPEGTLSEEELDEMFGPISPDYGEEITVENTDEDGVAGSDSSGSLEMGKKNAVSVIYNDGQGNRASIMGYENSDGTWQVQKVNFDGTQQQFTQDSMSGSSVEGAPSVDLTALVAGGYTNPNASVHTGEISELDAINITAQQPSGAPLPGMKRIDDLSQADFVSTLGMSFDFDSKPVSRDGVGNVLTSTRTESFSEKVLEKIEAEEAGGAGVSDGSSNPIIEQLRSGMTLEEVGLGNMPGVETQEINPVKPQRAMTSGGGSLDTPTPTPTPDPTPDSDPDPTPDPDPDPVQDNVQPEPTGPESGTSEPSVGDFFDDSETEADTEPTTTIVDDGSSTTASSSTFESEKFQQLEKDGEVQDLPAYDEDILRRSTVEGVTDLVYEDINAFDDLVHSVRKLDISVDKQNKLIDSFDKGKAAFKKALIEFGSSIFRADLRDFFKSLGNLKKTGKNQITGEQLKEIYEEVEKRQKELNKASIAFEDWKNNLYMPESERIDHSLLEKQLENVDMNIDVDMARLKFGDLAYEEFGDELEFDSEIVFDTPPKEGEVNILPDDLTKAVEPEKIEIEAGPDDIDGLNEADEEEEEDLPPVPRTYGADINNITNIFGAESVNEKLQRLNQSLNPQTFNNKVNITRDRFGDLVEWPFEALGGAAKFLGDNLQKLRTTNQFGSSLSELGDGIAGIGQVTDDLISGTPNAGTEGEGGEDDEELMDRVIVDMFTDNSGISPLTEHMRDKFLRNRGGGPGQNGGFPMNTMTTNTINPGMRGRGTGAGRGVNTPGSGDLFGTDMTAEGLSNMASGFDLSTPEGQRAYAGLYGQGALNRELSKRGLGNLLGGMEGTLVGEELDLSDLVQASDYRTKKYNEKPERDIAAEITKGVSEAIAKNQNNVNVVKPSLTMRS